MRQALTDTRGEEAAVAVRALFIPVGCWLTASSQHDTKLTEALRPDQELRAKIQDTVNGAEPGGLRYVLVSTPATGVISAMDYVMDEQRLGRPTIILAGSMETPRTGEA